MSSTPALTFNVELSGAGEQIAAVMFSARQGTKVLVGNKNGHVDASGTRVILPFSAEETQESRDGVLLIQGRIVTVAGRRAALNPHAISTRGPVV